MTLLYLVRHGTNDFTGKRLVGRTPGVHLNDAGRKQAAAVSRVLQSRSISAIYSSPLERAMETAFPLGQILNLPIQPQPGLQEVDFGEWQGLSTKKMQRRKLFKVAQQTPSLMRFPGGESYQEAQERVVRALIDVTAGVAEDKAVACFSHSDVICLAIAHFIGLPLDSFHSLTAETGSICVLSLKDNRNALLKMNWLPGDSV
jgi:probable phosphoglycerate mutase